MNNEIWTQRMAELYNPGGEHFDGYDPEWQEKQIPALCRLAETYVKEFDTENSTGWASEIEKAGETTLYKTLKKHPGCNWVIMMGGECTPQHILEITQKGLVEERKKYEFCLDSGEKFIETFTKVTNNIRAVYASGLVGSKYGLPSAKDCKVLNTMLKDSALPEIEEIVRELSNLDTYKEAAEESQKALTKEKKRFEKELADIREITSQMQAYRPQDLEIKGDGTIPEGKMVWKKASEVFTNNRLSKDFDVPFFEWDGPHPFVPVIDPHYIFRKNLLEDVLYAITGNQRHYLQGDTGSGKTTLIEQVAAYLNFPFIRINFDSEITRADLVGQHKLTTDTKTGATVSEFVEGLLPQAMAQPCFACFDEIDFVRPDVAYVMQAATEGNSFKIMEDGGREVAPHPMFRMFATGNTVGQGDEEGRYQGARPQSLALLDRFTTWSQVPYLDAQQRKNLLQRHYPTLLEEESNTILQYVTEHLEAFKQNRVHQPISPRGILALGRHVNTFGDVKKALDVTVVNRASSDDKATLLEIINRVVK